MIYNYDRPPIRMCFLHRPNATSGGDFVALNKYTEALTALYPEVAIEFRNATEPGDLSPFDFVHLWAACSPDWGLPAAHTVKEQGKPLIITPFWWSRAERQAFYGRPGEDLAPGYTPAVAQTLGLADVLFTVTMSEAQQCWMLAPRARVHLVPMGSPERRPIQETEQFVLCIGRIEPHKNQYMLALACQRLGLHLHLIGDCPDSHYAGKIQEFRHVSVSGSVSEKEKEITFPRARVHALPSFFENPGLVHGEANAYGVPAVMGNRGAECEHHGPGGIYCDPTNLDDICAALEEAWNRPRGYWADLPTWEDSARAGMEWMRYRGERSQSRRATIDGAVTINEWAKVMGAAW